MSEYVFSQLVLNWFHENGRKELPWQKNKTLYKVWISEIMLQQTMVKTVIPYFKKFILRFPDIKSLKTGTLNQILHLWSGLGYYNRAKNIYKTAQIITEEYQSNFPDQFSILIKLPGIGKSTAGAILSLSKNYFFSILDSNVKRILIRYYGIIGCIKTKQIEKKLWNTIELVTPLHNTGKFNQAMMDIGSLVCTSKQPKCYICPLQKNCIAKKNNTWERYSLKKTKSVKIKKISWFVLIKYKNTFWMTNNSNQEIWKNLYCFPRFNTKVNAIKWLKENKINIKNFKNMTCFLHHFSHFVLHVKPILITLSSNLKNFENNHIGIWYNLNNPQYIGLPRAVEKILKNFI